jgi:phosphoribosyl 1,2-cyclic phosphate phosphodiesterase
MKIKILGSGSSVGVPMCMGYIENNGSFDSNEPKNYRMRSSFYFEDNGRKILVECGPDFREQTIKYNITNFDEIFLSHNHHDHIGGIWEVENIKKFLNKDLHIYCNTETMHGINKRFLWMFDENCNSKHATFDVIEPYKTYNELFILKATHGDLESIGFRYKNFIFTPDLNILPNESKKYMKNADLWILQCNILDSIPNSTHTDLKMALGFIEELQPKQAILTHLSSYIDYNKVTKLLPTNVSLAFDGMEIEI